MLTAIVAFFGILVTLKITSQSKISGYDLKVDRFRFIKFLITNDYYKGEGLWKTAEIVLTSERQPHMAITADVNQAPFQSVSIKNDQKELRVLAHYDNTVVNEIISYAKNGQRRMNQDFLAYICVAQTKYKNGFLEREDCYKKAGNYLDSNSTPIFRLEKTRPKSGFSLVSVAKAAACTGLVECEERITTCTCSTGGTCSTAGSSCGPLYNRGTCSCSSDCGGGGGGAMDYFYCSALTNQTSCLNQVGADEYCASKNLCAVSGGCSWSSGGGPTPTPSPGGTISCGTQTCNASTEVCCSTGCKPISEGCTVATPTPAPSYTCTVQGYKVVMPGNQNIAPANSQTVTLNDPATSTSTQPYYFFYQSASKTRTVSVSVPANYTVGYTLCYNSITCHNGAPVMSSSVNLADNSFCGSSNGYADLWWHYYPPPSCTISFNSPNYSMSVGSSQTAGTNVTFSNGTISSVNFASSNTGIATINPASDTANPYTTSITGVSGGSSTVTANVIMSGVSRCSATTAVSVTSNPWWQVKDSDVATNQDLRSTIPPGLMFGKNGDGGYPGVAVYGTSTNLTKTNVSATGWLVNTTYSTSKIYDSNYFINSIPGDAVINPILSSSVAGSFFASGGTAYNGYYWYVYDGTANGGIPLTITTPSAVLGPRKVILIVKGANLSIKGNIKLTKGSGFFLAVAGENTAGSYGDIIVDPGVGGGGSANLEGIYVADGTFSSGTGGTSQLWVRGTVAAYEGINLQRDLGSATNTTTPAEYFEYAPDQELLFPVDLAYSLTTWREVAP